MVEGSGQEAQTTYSSEPLQPIKLAHSVREMRCYTVTDSELKQLGLANLGIAATFGLGSAFFAFGLDVYKDTVFVDAVPPEARLLSDLIQPGCFYIGVALWGLSALLFVWRAGLLRIIKKESGDRRPFLQRIFGRE